MTCRFCADGPRGIEGHPYIVVNERVPTRAKAIFRCTECDATYARNYEGDGAFVWVRNADEQCAAE